MEYHKYHLGDLIEQYDELNTAGEFLEIDDLQGINSNKYFQDCKSNKNDINLLRYRICRKGMFSYNRATSRNGEKISIAYRTGEDCIVSPSYYCFYIKDENVVNPEYLDIWFKRPVFDRYARFNSWGSATEFFSFDDFCDTEILLPDLPDQKVIVNEFKVVLNRIELLQGINSNLMKQAFAIYKKMFVQQASEGETRGKTTIGDLCSMICRGVAPKYDENSDQIVLNQKCVRDHSIDLSFSRRHVPAKVSEKWLKKGDLLINSTGEGTLGRAAQVWFEPHNMTVDSHVTIVRPKEEKYAYYIGFWGLTNEAKIEALHTGSTGQTELPGERIREIEVPVPDEDIVNEFNRIIQPFTETIICNQSELKTLNEIVLLLSSRQVGKK